MILQQLERQTLRSAIFFAASLLCAGSIAAAQQPGSMQGPSSQQQQMPNEPGSPGSPASGMPESNAPSQSMGDQIFVHDVLEGSQAQAQMSQLAQQKSSSADVQKFSQQMVQTNNSLSDQLKPAAKQLGVDEPKQPSKKERQQIEKLQALSGPDFDTEYIQAMAKQQQHDLKEFKDEPQSGQTANIQQAAKQDEPVLAEHYQVLEKLAQAHNVTLESKN
jgi:putative membrane protein